MSQSNRIQKESSPLPLVAVGGVGGSGTRLIAQFLTKLGFFVGDDLNSSMDNLLFTMLFKRIDILNIANEEFNELARILFAVCRGEILSKAQVELIRSLSLADNSLYSSGWLSKRVEILLGNMKKNKINTRKYSAWKEPNTHIVINQLQLCCPNLKYIHVVRNGLDMAFSSNQNQLKMWGRQYLNDNFEVSPRYSLKYWVSVHERLLDKTNDNTLFLNFDDLCINPVTTVEVLLDFLGIEDNVDRLIKDLTQMIHPPSTIGRFYNEDIGVFDKADINFVESMGFDVGNSESRKYQRPC